jgi:DNA invertase Pin-like site-specific DNA recombinase
MPEANRLTVHVIAAIAEYERQVISQRTKSALQRAKSAGRQLGNPNVDAQQRGAVIAAQLKADEFARKMKRFLDIYDPGATLSATKLANILTAEGIRTARGKWWSAASIIAIRARIAGLRDSPATP